MAARSALDVLKRILLSFRRNWGLKLVSLLFAIILWNYVIAVVNPTITMTIRDIPITVQTTDITQLNNSGLTVSGDIGTILKNANVTISIPRNDSFQFNKNNITVTASFSSITRQGPAEVRLSAWPSKGTVQNISPSSITVNIDKLEKRMVPVNCVLDGIPPQDYWIGKPQVNPPTLEISGPSVNVKRVDRAEVHIDQTNQTGEISAQRDFTFYDSKNNVLDVNALGIETPSNCIVDLQILPTKKMTVDAKNSVNGNPAWGYEKAGDPVVEPSQITIAGPQSALDALGDTLELGTIDITGANASKSVSMTPKLPAGVQFVGTDTVQVLVNIQPVLTTVTIKDVRVSVVGLASGLKADKTYTVNATLTVPEIYAARIRRANLTVTADASGLGAGAHALALVATYSDPEAAVQNDAIKLEPASITVTLSSKAG